MNSYLSKFLSGNSRSVTIKKNIIGSFFIRGLSIIISLMLVPLTLGYVSSELYGIWLTLSSIVVWLNFFDIGFGLGLKNKLAEAVALQDWKRARSLVSTTYFIMILIFVPICLLLEFIVPLVNWSSFLNVHETYNLQITKAIHVLIACFCLQMIINVFISVVSAFQKVALSSAFPVIGNLLSLIIIYLLTKTREPSLVALAFAISAMPIIVIGIFSVILFNGKFKRIKPSYKSIDKRYVSDLFGLGIKFFFIQIQLVVLYQSTNILISNVSGPNEVTSYNIAYKCLSTIMMVFSIIISPLWPAFTDAYAKKDFTWMKNIYSKMSKIYIIVAFLLLCMIIGSPIIYQLWIGDKANIPFSMTCAIGIYMMIFSWDSLQISLINGIGAIKLQTCVTLIGLIGHIPLALLLGNYFGAIGIVFSMIIINTIYSAFFTIQIRKILNQKARGIWIN